MLCIDLQVTKIVYLTGFPRNCGTKKEDISKLENTKRVLIYPLAEEIGRHAMLPVSFTTGIPTGYRQPQPNR